MARPFTVAATLAGAGRLQPVEKAMKDRSATTANFMGDEPQFYRDAERSRESDRAAPNAPEERVRPPLIHSRGSEKSRPQTPLEEIEHGGFQLPCRGATDLVRLLRVQGQFELFARGLQRAEHLQRVLKQHVVVFDVVRDHQPP